jgi:hypothetical protein
VTVYCTFTVAALAERCPAPLAALGRACLVPKAAEPTLEHLDPFRPPRRASDGEGSLDPGRRRRVSRYGEKRRKIGDQRLRWRHRYQLVILACKLRPGARPWPIFSAAHQPGDHRIKRDVTRRRHQVRLVHHHRPKATLEQMARPPEPSV